VERCGMVWDGVGWCGTEDDRYDKDETTDVGGTREGVFGRVRHRAQARARESGG
jgi:hypothetical protein